LKEVVAHIVYVIYCVVEKQNKTRNTYICNVRVWKML